MLLLYLQQVWVDYEVCEMLQNTGFLLQAIFYYWTLTTIDQFNPQEADKRGKNNPSCWFN